MAFNPFQKMKPSTVLTGMMLTGLALPGAAQAEQQAHVHGIAELLLAVEGGLLELRLESPAMNLVGFEHKAMSAEQQAVVEQAEQALEKPEALFGLKDGNCLPTDSDVDLSAVEGSHLEHGKHEHDHEKHEHAEHEHDHKEHHEHEEHDHHESHAHEEHEHKGHSHEGEQHSTHSEITADYEFECGTPDALNSIQLSIAEFFPGIETLIVSWVSEQGQGQTILNHEQLKASPAEVRFR
ncbi:MAG: ZrgA family zinc uptake protein [Oceanobacter sp.]